MDFIERWLSISPDGGNGVSELLIAAVIAVTMISIVIAARRDQLLRNVTEFLEQLGKRENYDHFDN